eukprot:g13342.t1
MLMFTSERERPGQCCPRKVVLTLRGNEVAAQPVDGDGAPPTRRRSPGVVSQKGNKAQPNQDCAFYFDFKDSDGAKIWCACVMDGHGPLGHEMSTLAMQWLPLLILREPLLASEPGRLVPLNPQTVFSAIEAAFEKMGTLMQKASSSGWGPRSYSGATCTFALGARGLLHTANIGDSRPSENEGVRIACRIRVLAAQGGIVARQRVYLDEWPYVGLNMSRSLGDAKLHQVGVSDVPDVSTVFLDAVKGEEEHKPQFLVVASDGVGDFTTAEEAATLVGRCLRKGQGPQTAAEMLATWTVQNRFEFGCEPGGWSVLQVLQVPVHAPNGLRFQALADVCGSLCDEAFVPAESLQPLTQQLIDRLRCRDPQTLERIGEVYSSFAERPGLTPLEFQGYVACVLTQILRPLDARNEPRNEPPRARPFAATLQAEAPAEAPPPAEAPEAPEELSELQRLAKELDSLNASLTEHQKEPLPAPMDLEKAPAPTEVKAETAHEVEQKDEMAHLLANLDDLNSSLQPLRRRASPTRDDTAAAEHMAPGCAAEARRTALAPEKYVQGPHAHPQPGHPHHHQPGHPHHLQPGHPHHPQPAHPHYPQHPSSPPRDVAHSLEHVFPVAPQAQQAQQGMMAQTAQHRHAGRSPLGPAEAFDAGNTYARALRGGAGAAARGAGLERRMEVPEEGPMMPEAGLTMEGPPMGAAIPGPMPAALAAAMPVANAVNSRLQGAGKGIAYSWQAFAETMDSIFAGDASSHAAGPEPEVALPEVALPAPAPMPAPEDVPLIFRQPTVEEVREVLEQEGLLAYVATAAGSFCPKKLCLDSSYLYILEPDSSIPAAAWRDLENVEDLES